MCTATYAVTMAELKEPAHNNLWYSPVQMSTTRTGHAVDNTGLSNPASASPHSAVRPRQGGWGSVDHHSQYPSYSRYSQDDGTDPYDRHQQQQQQHHHQQQQQQQHSLTSHQSFPSLKRPYSATEQPPYQEMVQDLRDDGSKLGVGHDHKLLSFRKVPDKHTIVDAHGRIQQLELTAQLHGMFFLSEMPATNNDGSVLQPELTCYRRNLFQVSGSLITPRGQLSVMMAETGETVPVSSTEVTISAIESVDGHAVRLIVIPWKTPPPNSPEVNQQPDQEPSSLPLIPFQDDGSETDGEYAVYPIGWRRLQFRIATANNGRRKELQQHFVVHLKVMATLTNGTKLVLTEASTAPIVVRGRSPRNFQARKEIPLLGSSAGSRGQALVETGLGIVAGPLTIKTQDVKARPLNMEMPRSAFTFSAPKLPTSPMNNIRSNSYPTSWNPSMAPASGPTNYPATTIASDPYLKTGFTAEPQEMGSHLPSSMPSMQLSMISSEQPGQQQQQQTGNNNSASTQVPPIRTQYASYVQPTTGPPPLSSANSTTTSTAGGPNNNNNNTNTTNSNNTTNNNSLNIPRYVDDSNPRPTKSPRHPSHPSIHAGSISSSTDSPNEYRYGPPYGSISSASADISPQTHHAAAPYPGSGAGSASGPGPVSAAAVAAAAAAAAAAVAAVQDTTGASGGAVTTGGSVGVGAGNPSNNNTIPPPPRDYFPSATSWTTTAGESTASGYATNTNNTNTNTNHNGGADHRASYPYSTDHHHQQHHHQQQQHHHQQQQQHHHQYKTSGIKSDPHAAPPTPVYPGQAMSHYSWNTS